MNEQIKLNDLITEMEQPEEFPDCVNCAARISQLNNFVNSLGKDLNHPQNKIESRVSCLPGFRKNTKMAIGLKIHLPKRDGRGNIIVPENRKKSPYVELPKTRTLKLEIECPGLVAENS